MATIMNGNTIEALMRQSRTLSTQLLGLPIGSVKYQAISAQLDAVRAQISTLRTFNGRTWL